jgi:hypothetical protein
VTRGPTFAVDGVVCRASCLGTILLSGGCGGRGATRFRAVNALPDESNLDVLVDGTTVASNVAYGTSTSYQSVKSGSRQVQFEPSGTTTSQLQQSVSFASGSDTTIIASNFSSSIAALVLTDENSAPSSGDFKLRVVNAAPGLGPADVYIVTPATDLNTVSPTLSSLGFDSYQSLSAGSYVLTPVGQKFVAIDTGSLMLSTGLRMGSVTAVFKGKSRAEVDQLIHLLSPPGALAERIGSGKKPGNDLLRITIVLRAAPPAHGD